MASIYKLESLEELNNVAATFLRDYPKARILAFRGEMGVGKTTFIKALCEVLDVADTVNSPSFAIINEYETSNGAPVYHFDFYRIKNTEEAYDFGYEDYFYSGHYCLIEWPEKIETLLPEQHIEVNIEEQDSGTRLITVTEMG
jgi:tRNA threonylcarbamoyladenosine biosynthesis protein TsaE